MRSLIDARLLVGLASILGASGVALGAFGAHALRSRLDPRDLEIFETAVRYQLLHALALLACAWVLDRWASPLAGWAGGSILAGTLVFSGSLYLLVGTGIRWLGAITPLGGLLLILGWILLAAGTLTRIQ